VPTGCGLLEPEVAGVIFDARRFHVEIFVARRLLPLDTINEDDRLPPPGEDWTGLATLGGALSGASGSDPSYSLRTSTLVARGATHLDFAGDLQTGGRYVIDRLALNHDWRDWQFTSGLYRSNPLRVFGETEVVGVRARSSLRTRTRLYLDRAYGSRLRVFLTRRSLVQIFRDGRLLTGRVYDVGNQELDTSELPSGAYEVQIVITDPVSGQSRESQFFAKTTDLPPLGRVHFTGEAGVIRRRSDPDDPLELVGEPFVRFGSAMRATPRFGLDFDMALVEQDDAGVMVGIARAWEALEWGHADLDVRLFELEEAIAAGDARRAGVQVAVVDGLRWLDLADPWTAAEVLGHATRRFPHHVRAAAYRAEALRRTGDPVGALEAVDRPAVRRARGSRTETRRMSPKIRRAVTRLVHACRGPTPSEYPITRRQSSRARSTRASQ